MRIALLAFICCTLFSSCFTSLFIGTVQEDRRPQSVKSIQHAFTDSSGSLVINFNAKLSGRKSNEKVHIIIPVDTLIDLYNEGKAWQFQSSDTIQKQFGVQYFYMVGHQIVDSIKNGLTLDLSRNLLRSGFYDTTGMKVRNATVVMPGHKDDYPYKNKETLFYLSPFNFKRKRMVLLYVPDSSYRYVNKQSSRPGKFDYIAIGIEPSSRRSLYRYGLTPVALAADAVTLPFQLMGYFMNLFGKKDPKKKDK